MAVINAHKSINDLNKEFRYFNGETYILLNKPWTM